MSISWVNGDGSICRTEQLPTVEPINLSHTRFNECLPGPSAKWINLVAERHLERTTIGTECCRSLHVCGIGVQALVWRCVVDRFLVERQHFVKRIALVSNLIGPLL